MILWLVSIPLVCSATASAVQKRLDGSHATANSCGLLGIVPIPRLAGSHYDTQKKCRNANKSLAGGNGSQIYIAKTAKQPFTGLFASPAQYAKWSEVIFDCWMWDSCGMGSVFFFFFWFTTLCTQFLAAIFFSTSCQSFCTQDMINFCEHETKERKINKSWPANGAQRRSHNSHQSKLKLWGINRKVVTDSFVGGIPHPVDKSATGVLNDEGGTDHSSEVNRVSLQKKVVDGGVGTRHCDLRK
jgi:hypothetical protein